MHILTRLLAKYEVSWLQNKAPKFSNRQWNFNTKSVMLLTALVSQIHVVLRWRKNHPVYIIGFTNISTVKLLNQYVIFWIDPHSELAEHAKLAVWRMFKEELNRGAASVRAPSRRIRAWAGAAVLRGCRAKCWGLSTGPVCGGWFPFAEYSNLSKEFLLPILTACPFAYTHTSTLMYTHPHTLNDLEARPNLGGKQYLLGFHEDKNWAIKMTADLNASCLSPSFSYINMFLKRKTY